MAKNSQKRYEKNQTKDPLVSVIVPTFNRKHLLPRTLNSLFKQSYNNIEIIVVNDAPDDDVSDILNIMLSSNPNKKLKYINNEKNMGLAGARNVGLKNATGEYICLLDDDDIYLEYALEFRMYMMKKLGAEIVYTRALLDHWEKKEDKYVSIGKTLYWDSPFDRDLILIQNIAPCCCPLFSRKAWDKAQYWFDETMTTSEDHDFWCALSRHTDFQELKLVDCECSKRNDNTQMTGKLNFVPNWIKIFQHWRHTAINADLVKKAQNDILSSVGYKPEEYGL